MPWLNESCSPKHYRKHFFYARNNFGFHFTRKYSIKFERTWNYKLRWKHSIPNRYLFYHVDPYGDLRGVFYISMKNNTFQGCFHSDQRDAFTVNNTLLVRSLLVTFFARTGERGREGWGRFFKKKKMEKGKGKVSEFLLTKLLTDSDEHVLVATF